MSASASSLAPHQREFLTHNGFLTLDAITTRGELTWLRQAYEDLFERRAGWEEGDQFDLAGDEQDGRATLPQLLNPSRYEPRLKRTTFLRRAQAIARQVFGEDLLAEYGEHMIYKPALTGPETPWHQDQAYHDPDKVFRSLNFWMPLDDASVESGCMQFVPGSHRLDVLPHHSIGDNPAVHGLEVDRPEAFAPYAAACPVPAGGCTLHSAYTLHYAGANTSATPRRAYILVFRARPVAREAPIDNYWMREKRTAGMQRASKVA